MSTKNLPERLSSTGLLLFVELNQSEFFSLLAKAFSILMSAEDRPFILLHNSKYSKEAALSSSKNSEGVILKLSQIFKNNCIDGNALPDVIDWIYPLLLAKFILNSYSDIFLSFKSIEILFCINSAFILHLTIIEYTNLISNITN